MALIYVLNTTLAGVFIALNAIKNIAFDFYII